MGHKINEVTLSGATQVVAGQAYAVNGRPTVAPTTQSVSSWATAIGGSPVIKSVDLIGRSTGWWESDFDG
jgi:hypothetical protein